MSLHDNFETKIESPSCSIMAGPADVTKETRGIYCNRAASEQSVCGSPTNSAMCEIEDDAFLDVTCVQMEQGSPEDGEENMASPESFGADPLRTLGEILAYCQVMYGAIQKLDAKFELLKTSVTTSQRGDPPTPGRAPKPSRWAHTLALNTQSPSSPESFQLKVEATGPASPTPPLQEGAAFPSGPAPSEGQSSTDILPIPDDITPAQVRAPQQAPPRMARGMITQHWPNSTEGQGHAHSNSTQERSQVHSNRPDGWSHGHGNASSTEMEAVGNGRCQPGVSSGPAITATPSHPRWNAPDRRRPPHPHTAAGNRKYILPSSFLRKAGTMARPTTAARFLMRSVFSRHELLHGNTRGDPSRGLRRLDPERLDAIREWAQKRYPDHELHDKGKDWRACLAVMNKATRYIRLMDRARRLNTVTDMNADMASIHDVEPESTRPIRNKEPVRTAEIDVELSDSESDRPQQQRALKNTPREPDRPRASANDPSNQEPLVFLGSAGRGVKVPQAALFGAWQRPRPPLVARYLIRFMFSEDVLVQSNVYGNTEHGIQPLDHNKISALREHLCERFHWMQLQEDGRDWKACVDAINSCIRKTRHKLKKSRL